MTLQAEADDVLSPPKAGAAAPRTSPHLRTPGRFILHHVVRWRGHFVVLFALIVGAAMCGIGQQYGLKLLVDAMAGQRSLTPTVAMGVFLSLVVLEAVLLRTTGWLVCRTTIGVGVDLRLELFNHLSGQSIRYFAENLAGSLGQRITATAGNFGALTGTLVWRILGPFVDVCGAVLIIATLDLGLTATLLGFVVLITGVLVWFGERGRPLHRSYSGQAAAVGGDLIDTISNMWTVKAFSAREREGRRLGDRFKTEAGAQRRSWMYLEKARIIHDVTLWFMIGVILTWAVSLWGQGRATPGSVILVASLTLRILHGSQDMALALIDATQQFGFIDETLSVIAKPQTVTDAPGAPALRPHGGAVEFRHITFGYTKHRRALDNISLFIPPGQKVGVVGPSGAGKSTLVHLIQRLYDVDRGQILIDGQPITAVTQDSLREGLAVVPQEISLLHRSVMENIRFARPEASDEEVYAAARAAACDNFIHALPHGYDTIVGERGAKLSGGQRQRIGIARAFLKRAPIILFDEATSALDTESEMEIQTALVRLMRDRTVISVAHRLSSLAAFDRILVVSDGRIVEDGTVAELRRRGGPFDRMWRLQAEGLSSEDMVDAA